MTEYNHRDQSCYMEGEVGPFVMFRLDEHWGLGSGQYQPQPR